MDKIEKNRNLLVRQYEYFQYLFEQEQKRAASIVNGAKVYIAFLVFIMGSIFLKVISLDKISALFEGNMIEPILRPICIFFVVLSGLSLFIAILFSILVLKVWLYHRLCDPMIRFEETLEMKDEIEVLSKSLSDFAVTISRNNRINNRRSEFLTYGLNFLLTGILFSIITTFLLTVIE